MNFFKKIKYNLFKKTAYHLSYFKNKRNSNRLRNNDFSIISQNCIGSLIYHDLNLRFLSPTINLFMSPSDFVIFVQHLKEFKNSRLHFIETESNYPVGYIKHKEQKVFLNFVHYKTKKEAAEKWHDRFSRINYDNVFLIMTDRDGCDDTTIKQFLELPYKKKLFTSKNIKHKDVIYCEEYSEDPQVGDLTEYVNIWGKRGFERFDIVEWLNSVK